MTTVARAIGQGLRSAGVRYVFDHPVGEVVDLIDGFATEGLEFVTKHGDDHADWLVTADAADAGQAR